MSFGFGMGSGLKALNAARLSMQTAGNNISNANTAGYSRQRVLTAADLPFSVGNGQQVGSGVRISSIERLTDGGIERRIRTQLGLFGQAEVDYRRLSELEGIFNEPGGGLSEDLGSLFSSIGALQTDPSDRALRGGVVQSGRSLSEAFNLMDRRLDDLSTSTFGEVQGLVRLVNENAQAVADLNAQIVSVEASGSTANDLRDRREQHIKEISDLLDTRVIERNSGSADLLVGGHLLVAGSRHSGLTTRADEGSTIVTSERNQQALPIRSGRIAGLLAQEAAGLPAFTQRIDELARSTILEFNRIHSTGVPRSGPFQSMRGAIGVQDGDGDGLLGDELLSQSGLPFDVQSGELYVNVTNEATGDLRRFRIDIDPRSMSLNDVASELNNIENLSASVDPTGRLRIAAGSGYGFDFSPRLDPNPNSTGSFGGANPVLGSASAGPFDLSGNTFPVQLDVTTGTAASPVVTTVTLNAADFTNPAAATAEELVTAINDDLGSAGTAEAVGGRLMIHSNAGGKTSQLTIADVGAGTVAADLGIPTATVLGQDNGVSVQIDGAFTGSTNGQLTFVPSGDGTVGVTKDLTVQVLDQNGVLVGTANIGEGYSPGEAIEIVDGITATFGPGQVAASSNQAFALDTIADSDTSDILVATGMNSFFHGTDAATIEVNPELSANSDLLSAALTDASGDAGNLDRLITLRDSGLAGLDDSTIENFYTDIVGDLGFEASAAETMMVSQDQLLAFLEAERDQVSGVNIDEEMVDLTRFQQAYEAAARYISTVQEMSAILINLGR